MSQDRKFERIKSPLDNNKFLLWGERWPNGGKTPSMQVRVVNNNVRLESWPRNPNEINTPNERRPITANMDPIYWGLLVESLRKAIANKEEHNETIINYTIERDDPQRTKVIQSKVQVGRDNGGFIYIGIAMRDRDPVKFKFQPNGFIGYLKTNGEAYPMSDMSDSIARSWVNRLEAAVDNTLNSHYVDEEKLREARNQWRREAIERKSDANVKGEQYGSSFSSE